MPETQLLPIHDWLVELRRELHRIPELGYQEEKTSAKICQVLDQLEVPYHTGLADRALVGDFQLIHYLTDFGRSFFFLIAKFRDLMQLAAQFN